MTEIELYENIQIPDTKKAQIKDVYLNKKLVIELTDLRLINALEFKFIFFEIPRWLMEATNFSSTKLYGRITKVSDKGLQINFTQWFPKSQILKIYYLKEREQTNLIKFMEDKYYEQRDIEQKIL